METFYPEMYAILYEQYRCRNFAEWFATTYDIVE